MTWNWYRHSDMNGNIDYSHDKTPFTRWFFRGNIRTRPATPEEIAYLERGQTPPRTI